MSRVRWGIVGAGHICHDFCMGLVANGSPIVTVAARDAAKAAQFAEKVGATRSAGEYKKVWEDPDVDAVYIGTITSSHYELSLKALEAGKAVLVEKPVALNAREAAVLVQTAASRGQFFMEGMWTRCFPVVRRVREELEKGTLGKLKAVQADFGICVPPDPKHRLWAPALGGGAVYDVGVYPIGAALLPFGGEMPSSVSCAGTQRLGVDEYGAISLSWGEAVASVSFGITAISPESAKYICEKGWITIDAPAHCPTRAEVHTIGGYGEKSKLVEVIEAALPTLPEGRSVNYPCSEGMLYQVQEAERCIREKLVESPVWTHKESVNTMRIIDDFHAKLGLRFPAAL